MIMDCPRWNDGWIAHLYGELEPAEERSLAEHLAGCDACRDTLDRLARTRTLLHTAAEPSPGPSRVMVLAPSRSRPLMAFAAGVACAGALFLAGLYARPLAPAEPGPAEDTARTAAVLGALEEQARRLERLESAVREPRPAAADVRPAAAHPAALTRDDLRRSIEQLETRWQHDRARELEFLVRSISAAQARVDETQEALQVLAVRDDPRYRER
jgi:anti-sigma factor RsiW